MRTSSVIFRACAVLCAVSLAGLPTVNAAERDTDDVVPTVDDQVDGWNGIVFRDRSQPADRYSYVKVEDPQSKLKPCVNAAEGLCSTNARQQFQAIIQRCVVSTDVNCISDMGVVDASGKRTSAVFAKTVPSQGLWDFDADTKIDLPKGGNGQLYSIPSATHNAGNDYFVRVRLNGSRIKPNKFEFNDFDVSLYAVELVEGPCVEKCFTSTYYNEAQQIWALNGVAYFPGRECVSTSEKNLTRDTHDCVQRRSIPLDKTFYVTVRLSQTPVGWMHGRLQSPEVKLTTDATTSVTTVDIQGSPMTVPVVIAGKLWSQLPSNLQAVYSDKDNTYQWPGSTEYGGSYNSDGPNNLPKPNVRRITYRPSPSGPPGIAELQAWVPVISDKASANVSTWGVRTLNSTEMKGVSSCFTKEKTLSGIVTTNATQYTAGPPSLNTSTSTLDYQVAAPHYTSGGSVFRGVYHLIMRSDVARCLYGFGSGPLSASIAVANGDGSPADVTTNVSESDGWLKMSASGFTHSAPVVRATITGTASTPATESRVVARFLKTRKTASYSSLVKWAGLSVAKNSKITTTVSKKSAKYCKVAKSNLVGVKKGSCSIVVTVITGKKKTSGKLTIGIT